MLTTLDSNPWFRIFSEKRSLCVKKQWAIICRQIKNKWVFVYVILCMFYVFIVGDGRMCLVQDSEA